MIDILLPYYGSPALLEDAVRSVLAQTSPDWRLLVVDDAYPGDAVGPWVKALDDPRIEYVRNDENLGFARNFQRCLDLATAEHILFLGGDDRLLPDYVQIVSDTARRSGVAMVQPGVAVIDGDGQRSMGLTDRVKRLLRPRADVPGTISGEDAAVSLMRGAWTYFPSICWRRDSVLAHGFKPEHGLALDVALIMDVLMAGGELLLLDRELFEYRRHQQSASVVAARATDRFAAEAAFFEAMRARFIDHGWGRAARAARIHLTSRMHAATLLPHALTGAGTRPAGALLRHVLT